MGPTLYLHRDRLRAHHARAKTPHRPRIPSPRRNRRHDRRRRERRALAQSGRHRDRTRVWLRHRHRSRRHGAAGVVLGHRGSRAVRAGGIRQPQEDHRVSAARRLVLRVLARDDERRVRPAAGAVLIPDDHHLLLYGLRGRDGARVRGAGGGRAAPQAAAPEDGSSGGLAVDAAGVWIYWRHGDAEQLCDELLVFAAEGHCVWGSVVQVWEFAGEYRSGVCECEVSRGVEYLLCQSGRYVRLPYSFPLPPSPFPLSPLPSPSP